MAKNGRKRQETLPLACNLGSHGLKNSYQLFVQRNRRAIRGSYCGPAPGSVKKGRSYVTAFVVPRMSVMIETRQTSGVDLGHRGNSLNSQFTVASLHGVIKR